MIKRIVSDDTYPANVISAIFGEVADGYGYYFDDIDFKRVFNNIMRREFVYTDRTAFYSLYKNNVSEKEIAEKLQCTEETVGYIISRILRYLRYPDRAEPMRDRVSLVKVFENDGDRPLNELLSVCGSTDVPVAVVENRCIKAFVLDAESYDNLVGQARSRKNGEMR